MVESNDKAARLKKIEADFVELERLDRLKNHGELSEEDYDSWVAYYISVLRLFDVEYGYALTERRSMRLPIKAGISVTHQGKSFDATTMDLSVGGIAISHREGIDVGQDVELELSFGPSDAPLHLKGCVRWASAVWDKIGIQFVDVSGEVFETLENGVYGFIRSKLEETA